jgi:hypothetical protein
VPAVRLPVAGCREIVAGAVLELKTAESQPDGWPAEYAIVVERPDRLPEPVLVTVTVCAEGLPPPCEALKLTMALESVMVDAAVTVNATDTFWGLLLATPAATATFAVYVPGSRLPVENCSVAVAGAVVELRLAAIQPVGCPAV